MSPPLKQMLKKLVNILIPFLFLNCFMVISYPTNLNRRADNIHITPSATIIRSEGYKILGTETGETSTFFLFGLIPMTNPLNMEYALSQAVQKVEGGDSMVNMTVWHETHYFYPLGTVSVTKVRGDIVSLKTDSQAPLFEEPNKNKPLPGKKGAAK
jgi:hypothetical protein